MSTCMFVIRNIQKTDAFRNQLVNFVSHYHYGIDFSPCKDVNFLYYLNLQSSDCAFSLCDTPEYKSCDLIVYRDGQALNGREDKFPLAKRLEFVQGVAEIVMQYTEKAEFYIGDDNPTLPDFSICDVKCSDLAQFVYSEYERTAKECFCCFTPYIELHITK